MPATWTCPTTSRVFPTGLMPSSRLALAMKTPFRPIAAPPENSGWFPTYRSNYGNDRWGCCVTSEEAFVKSCYGFNIPDSVVTDWARAHGVLNGASLGEVLSGMQTRGFQVGAQLYDDGPSFSVDYTNETLLRTAVAQAPVKIAIASSALPGGAGSRDGFYATTTRARNTDHCVSVCAQGTAEWIFDQLKVPLPSGLSSSTRGYGLYSWSTIGFVTQEWVDGTCDEADIRTPTNIGVPPLPDPKPLPPPAPLPIAGTLYIKLVGQVNGIFGDLQTADGTQYVVAPDGAGNFHVIPKVIFK